MALFIRALSNHPKQGTSSRSLGDNVTPRKSLESISTVHHFARSPLIARHSPGQPLNDSTRAQMEQRFGHDFGHVRVHADSQSAHSTQAVNARAFTVGHNIYFGDGEYEPTSHNGMRLLTHELAHSVQQSGRDSLNENASGYNETPDSEQLEQEANGATEKIIAGQSAQIVGSAPAGTLQRQAKDAKNQSATPTIVSPLEASPAQRKIIEDARRAAAIRTQIAMFKARGTNGPIDFHSARQLAQIKFDWAEPNMEQVGDILAGMGGGLVNVNIMVAGANDPECGNRSGYVRGNRPPIVICPAFFRATAEQQIRTTTHEMAHVMGIGKAEPNEQYFLTFDCTSKGAFESADAWANYVHCLSGQTPDQPDSFTMPPKGNKANQTAPKKHAGGK